MIDKARIVTTACTQPHKNLALEEALLASLAPHEAILFLWQNRHTVVIGAGQNAWRECHVKRLQEDGGTLARRSTGGGAVYHDLGNLNFSLIVPPEDYDVARQSQVILRAVRSLGIDAERTGRNDLTAQGRKFSGNAFRVLKTGCLHHGTLLLHSDMEKVARYLIVDPDKLKSKGVKSVPARVINLCDLAPVTVDSMKEAMMEAFTHEYGAAKAEDAESIDAPGLDELIRRYESWEWNFAASPAGGEQIYRRFPWGGVEITAQVLRGRVEGCAVFTDSMDETLKFRLEDALEGVKWTGEALYEAISPVNADVALWLKETV